MPEWGTQPANHYLPRRKTRMRIHQDELVRSDNPLRVEGHLPKPADADEILAAFGRTAGDAATPVETRPLSVARLEWEHIQKVLNECGGNISETARRLAMHRRTLQRKLAKRPVRS